MTKAKPCAECGHPKSEHHDGTCDLCGYLFASPGRHEYRPDEDA
jgi:ribosomal protein L37E